MAEVIRRPLNAQPEKGAAMHKLLKSLTLFGVATALAAPVGGLLAQQAEKRQQYVYVLRLAARLHDAKAWTEADNAAVSRHFARLSQAAQAGSVILAGRTNEPLDKTFGLVIFEAGNAEDAKRFMEADPAVTEGVMSATLHPYVIALQRKP